MIARWFGGLVLWQCPRCHWRQRVWLRHLQTRTRACEHCGRSASVQRLTTYTAAQPLDSCGHPISYRVHIRHDVTGRLR